MMEDSSLIMLFESVLETAVDGIINIDSNGKIFNINRAAVNIFGYSKEEVIGKSVNMLMNNHDSERHDQYINNYLTTRKPQIIGIGREVMGKKKDKSLFPFRLAVSEVVLNDKVIFTGIIHDLQEIHAANFELKKLNEELDKRVNERTYEVENAINHLLETNKKLQHEIKERMLVEDELKQKEIELQEALALEKELNQLKTRFVTTASHEFRTPLTSILSSASLISKYPSEEDFDKREKHVNKIKVAVVHLTGLLNDFLSLSMIEERKVNVQKEDFSLKEMLDQINDELKNLYKNSQTLEFDFDFDKLFSDKKIVKNILFNLISNAVKYSEKNIEVACLIENGQQVVKVIDQGIGIPKDDLKFLTQRFFRATNVGNTQGTGLGLNIVINYCDLINAKFEIESQENIGTTTKITFY